MTNTVRTNTVLPDTVPRRVVLVLGTTAGGLGAHARMLAAGLAERGVEVAVAGPPAADALLSFSALPVTFTPVAVGARPGPGTLRAVARLRRLLRERSQPGLVAHAHGLRAGALVVLALLGVRGSRRPLVVVTVHNAGPAGTTAGPVYRLLERVVARGADLVLCVSPDLERRLRAVGARRVARAVVAAGGPPAGGTSGEASTGAGRPVVLAAGRLAAQKDHGSLLTAAAAWRDLDPEPLVVIAGDGPLAAELRAAAAALGIDARFLGRRADVPALLAAAAVFVLPSRWEGQPLVLQEALRAGAAIVATRVGGIPDLTGEDAALLVPPGDTAALASAVRAVLTDAALAARLRQAAAARAELLPSPAGAVDAALSAYESLISNPRLR